MFAWLAGGAGTQEKLTVLACIRFILTHYRYKLESYFNYRQQEN